MDSATDAKLQVHKSGQGDITFLRFVGTVDERFDGSGVAKGLEGQLVISLGEVRRITSFGIRQWVDFIGAVSARCRSVYLVECAPRIVDQLNMVANFAGRGMVVSFYAPFRCGQCGNERLRLVQVDQERESLRALRLDGEPCPNDGTIETLDDDVESYLSYIAAQPELDMDPKVAAFLAGRTQYAVPQGMRKIRLEKKIQDRYTFISVSGDIGDDLQAAKVGEGLEGDVVFDLAAVGQFTEAGIARWRSLMQAIAPATERIILLGLPAVALEHLKRREDLADKGQVLTLYLPFACKSCAITTQVEIDVAQHFEQLRLSTPPEMACPDCGKPADCAATTAMLHGLTELPPPAKDLETATLQRWARQPVEHKGSAAAALSAPSLPASAPLARSWPLLALLALLAVAGVAVGVFYVLKGKGQVDTFDRQAKLVEASHPSPPQWKDHSFSIRGDEVLISGASGYVPDKESGFEEARAAALEELSHQVAASIRDPLWVEHVGGQYQQFRAKLLGDLEKALVTGEQESITRARGRVRARREKVAEALLASAANLFQAEQSSYYWEKLQSQAEIRYRVWSLLRLRKAELRRLVERYTAREEALSSLAVTYFPGMAWRYDMTQGAIALGLRPDSPLRYIGLLPGDILLSAQDRAIKDARSFRRVLEQEQSDLQRTGGVLLLRIRRGDGPVVEHRLRVVKSEKGQPRPVGSHKVGPRPKGKGKDLPPANIWDDNPFE